MNKSVKYPRPDKDLTDQDKNALPEPEYLNASGPAEAGEFLDDELRMTDQPLENHE